jgi:hypothetical protein
VHAAAEKVTAKPTAKKMRVVLIALVHIRHSPGTARSGSGKKPSRNLNSRKIYLLVRQNSYISNPHSTALKDLEQPMPLSVKLQHLAIHKRTYPGQMAQLTPSIFHQKKLMVQPK